MTTTVFLNADTVTSRTSLCATCLRRPPEGSSLEAAVQTKCASAPFFSFACVLPSCRHREGRGGGGADNGGDRDVKRIQWDKQDNNRKEYEREKGR